MDARARYDAIVAEVSEGRPAVAPGQMFGMSCLKANGKFVAGFWEDSMVFKLPDAAAREGALALAGAAHFDPMGGRPMKEWVVVPPVHAERWRELAEAALPALD